MSETVTEINVECTSIAEWLEAGDQAHIVLHGDRADLKFAYKITGLEEEAEYAVELVFTPDVTRRFTRTSKSDGSWEFVSKEEDPPADDDDLIETYTAFRGFQTGKWWMEEGSANFDKIVFGTISEEDREDDELSLRPGMKYQVAVRITKEGVEKPVYEQDVPDQVFVACGQMSEPEEEVNKRKRKSEVAEEVAKKRADLEGSPEDDQPGSSGDTTPEASEPRSSKDSLPTPEDEESSTERAPSPSFGQVPPRGVLPNFTDQPPPPYQGPYPSSNRPPAFAQPPAEEAPADGDPEEEEEAAPVPRARIGTNQFSAFQRPARRPQGPP